MIAMALRGGAKSKIGEARFGKCRLTITPPEFSKVRERRIFRKKNGGRGPTGPHSYGDSADYAGGESDDTEDLVKTQGMCQGNRAAPAAWTVTSIPTIEAHRRKRS
jgi:hypothetical protein